MDFTVKTKCAEIVKSVPGLTTNYSHIFSYFVSVFLLLNYFPFYERLHFATYMCYINYKFICYAHFCSSYYSQLTCKIGFEHSVIGYIIVYNNYVILFIIYVCLMTEIEYDVGEEGHLTYV